jgi:hypothetical protein
LELLINNLGPNWHVPTKSPQNNRDDRISS